MNPSDTSILLIYTGGTIGMIENPETGALENLQFRAIAEACTRTSEVYLPDRLLPIRSAYGLFGHGTGSLEETGTRHQ